MKINTNLIPLKCLLFVFYGGMGCLLPFLPSHMFHVGLTVNDAFIISIVAPLVAIIGPLVVSPIADRYGSSGGKTNGRPIRIMFVICAVLTILFYLLLEAAVPMYVKHRAEPPVVSFSCDENGAFILQEKCGGMACYKRPEEEVAELSLENCRYDCHRDPSTMQWELQRPDEYTTVSSSGLPIDSESGEAGEASGNSPFDVENEADIDFQNEDDSPRRKRYAVRMNSSDSTASICFKEFGEKFTCLSATVFGYPTFNITLHEANDTDRTSEKVCHYSISKEIFCQIPDSFLTTTNNASCKMLCDVRNPYSGILPVTECSMSRGSHAATFWSYLVIRSIADIFPMAAIALLDTVVVIATRETAVGRGDVGHEFVWGSLGFAIFAPIAGALLSATKLYIIPFAIFAILMAISLFIILFAKSLPLNPPDWWWHAKSMSRIAIRRCWCEISALAFVLFLLGALWSSMDSFLPWHLRDLGQDGLLMGLTLTVGVLPAIPFLWWSEKVIDYCGHSNLLITAFTFYIIRFTIVSYLSNPWFVLLSEAFEVFTMSLMWVTAIVYMRSLVPRHLTTTGQGIAVAAHFCFGRAVGAIVAAIIRHSTEGGYLVTIYTVGAIAAAIIASVYFIVYHCIVRPRCITPPGADTRHQQPIAEGPTTNGTYTPLKVYNGKGQQQKEQVKF